MTIVAIYFRHFYFILGSHMHIVEKWMSNL